MDPIYASIDLGGTSIKCAFGSADGSIRASASIPTESHLGPEGVLSRMAQLVRQLETRTGHRPSGAGIGIPGLVDLKNGFTRFLPNFPTKWRDVPVRETLAPLIGCDVFLLNDVRMATLGELTFGHGRDAGTMVFFALGTGIGGGITIDGRLRLGPLGAAGELGHVTIEPDGPLCGCGNRGCLETLISGPALTGTAVRLLRSGQSPELHEVTGGDIAQVTPQTIAEAVKRGDQSLGAEVIRAAEYLGIGIANVVTSIHPDLVVLGGGVAQMGDLLLAPVRRTVLERVRMFPADTVRIERSQLGEQAGTLGGIALAMNGGLVD